MNFFSKLHRDSRRARAIKNGDSGYALGVFFGLNCVFYGAIACGFLLPAALLIPAVVVPVAVVTGATAGVWICKGQIREILTKDNKNDVTHQNTRMIGAPLDLGMMVGSLGYIEQLTRNFNAAAALPDKVRSKVETYIRDMEPIGPRIAAFNTAQGNAPLDYISVTRDVLAADGQYQKVELGRVAVARAPLPAVAPAPDKPASAPEPSI